MAPTNTRVTRVALAHLVPNPYQPRFTVDDSEMDSLVASIKEHGFFGHVEVRPDPDDPARPLQIVYGHRRVEAAKRAGLSTIPAAVVERTDDQMRRLTFVENAARKNLSYWEEAVFVAEMKRELDMSVRQVAAALGKSKSWVQERLDIVNLPEGALRDAAQRDEITFSAAWLLVQMAPEEQDRLLEAVKSGTINVSDLRTLRRTLNERAAYAELDDLENDLANGTGRGPRIRWVEPLDLDAPSGKIIDVPLTSTPARSGQQGATATVERPGRTDPDTVRLGEIAELLKQEDVRQSPPRRFALAAIHRLESEARALETTIRRADFDLLDDQERAMLRRAKAHLQEILALVQ